LGSVKPTVLGVSFADFIAPGLIIMGMMQNAFANSSFSLLVGKIQGTIVDYLMPPLSNAEVLAPLTEAAVTVAVTLVAVKAYGIVGAAWAAVEVSSAHAANTTGRRREEAREDLRLMPQP
jgi:ABC-2 type transport system permease protein